MECSRADVSPFPLSSRYTYHLCCTSCFQNSQSPSHSCRYDLLAVEDKESKLWFRVRSGQKHKRFKGDYNMCRYWKSSKRCPRGDTCDFAHGKPEQLLFTLEKDAKFNIAQFLSAARSQVRFHVTTSSSAIL